MISIITCPLVWGVWVVRNVAETRSLWSQAESSAGSHPGQSQNPHARGRIYNQGSQREIS